MFLGSYVKDYIGIWVLLIIYFFVYSYCSFLLYVKKLIKVGFKWFYWYFDVLVLWCSFKKYKKILIIYLKGFVFRYICIGYIEVI